MESKKENLVVAGSGQPVLLLHSAMSSKLQWYQIMRTMSSDYTMIACDLYGYGDSPFPRDTQNYSLKQEIAFVEKTIQDVIPKDLPFHLVGHSYGAATALRMAYMNPGRIKSLTLFEPVSFHILPQDDPGFKEAMTVAKTVNEKMAQGDLLAAVHFFIDFYSHRGMFLSMPRTIREMLAKTIKKLPHDFNALLSDTLTVEDYGRIDCPVCMIVGKKSPISSRRVAEYLAQKSPGFQLQWIDENHMAPVYKPDVVNPIIAGFIGTHR